MSNAFCSLSVIASALRSSFAASATAVAMPETKSRIADASSFPDKLSPMLLNARFVSL